MSAPLCTVTPLEALRRCVAVLKQVDYADCGESEALWCQHALALSEAEAVLAAPVVPVAAQPVVPDAINNAFVTLMHDSGSYSISLKFNKNSDVWAVHDFLLRSGGKEYNVAAPQPAASVTDVAKDADRKDADRWRMHLHLMIENGHRVREVGAIIDAVDAAIAAQQGEKTK